MMKQFAMDTQLIFQFLILVTRSTFTITVTDWKIEFQKQEGSTHNLLHCVQLLRPKLMVFSVRLVSPKLLFVIKKRSHNVEC